MVWTLVVWVGRVRNALADPDDPSSATGLWLALTFVLGALALAASLVAARGSDAAATARVPLVWALAGWTVLVWVQRMFGIVGGDRSAGFVMVHLVLAAVSSVLGIAAVREARSDRAVIRHTPSAGKRVPGRQ